ncbi:competence protein ComJ [Iodobacter sp. CM08]|uniref:competence protein ComJ n=1 Tax=Iodobacter sp. CM08 TaxID=3085902 RepID=UPI002981A56C|nr:competence protein ComJ [Iodobacter sp. CM08]MDW5418789.1 competence protein ComJ [Iodobacter sp. CM08]
MKNKQTFDMLISHNQIQIRSIPYDQSLCEWGSKNIEQGVLIHPSYISFDPLVEGSFGANIFIKKSDAFTYDSNAQRCMRVPFSMHETSAEVVTPGEVNSIDIGLTSGQWDIYYEICEDEEIYFNFTFIKSMEKSTPVYLMNDDYGGKKLETLIVGKE